MSDQPITREDVALELSNVLRSDVPHESLAVDAVLAMAPETADGRFQVPPVMGEAP